MLFKELFPIVLGGTGFVGLAGTSSYFLYQHVKINAIREEINQDLGELRDKILELIKGKEGKPKKPNLKKAKGQKPKQTKPKTKQQKLENPAIDKINQKIQELKNKNQSRWKNYTDQVESILNKYQEIIKKAEGKKNINELDVLNIHNLKIN